MTRLRRPSAKMGALQLPRLFRHSRRGGGPNLHSGQRRNGGLGRVSFEVADNRAETAIARHPRADHTGDVVLVIGMFA
jgi:hypothetical protein